MFISQNSDSSAMQHSEQTVTIMAAVECDLRPREYPLYIESCTVVLTWTSLLADRLLLRQLYMPRLKQQLPKLESRWFWHKIQANTSGRWWTPDGVSSIFGGRFPSVRNCTSFSVDIAMQNYSRLTKTEFASSESEVEIREVQRTLKHDTPHYFQHYTPHIPQQFQVLCIKIARLNIQYLRIG